MVIYNVNYVFILLCCGILNRDVCASGRNINILMLKQLHIDEAKLWKSNAFSWLRSLESGKVIVFLIFCLNIQRTIFFVFLYVFKKNYWKKIRNSSNFLRGKLQKMFTPNVSLIELHFLQLQMVQKGLRMYYVIYTNKMKIRKKYDGFRLICIIQIYFIL